MSTHGRDRRRRRDEDDGPVFVYGRNPVRELILAARRPGADASLRHLDTRRAVGIGMRVHVDRAGQRLRLRRKRNQQKCRRHP